MTQDPLFSLPTSLPFDQADHDALAVALAKEDCRAWFNLDEPSRAHPEIVR